MSHQGCRPVVCGRLATLLGYDESLYAGLPLPDDFTEVVITNGGNKIDDGATCGWGSANGSMSNANPLLGALTGSPAYFPLNLGSPAIDAGNNAVCAAAPVNNTSQNGVTRPTDGDGNGTATCGIGAFERHGDFRVYLPSIVK